MEAERHQQVGGLPVERVRLAGALADVPGVHRVVDELRDRVEARREGSHVLVRHQEATPLVGVEALEDRQHLGSVLVEPREQLVLRHVAEGERAAVDVLVHALHAQWVGRRAAGASGVEAAEVALGGVDEVADDVADLPVARRRGRLPRGRRRRQREHLVRLRPHGAQQVVLARRVEEVPLTHFRSPPKVIRRNGA